MYFAKCRQGGWGLGREQVGAGAGAARCAARTRRAAPWLTAICANSSFFWLLCSPWRILDDTGAAFAMGAIGGSVYHAIKGYTNSPEVRVPALQLVCRALGVGRAAALARHEPCLTTHVLRRSSAASRTNGASAWAREPRRHAVAPGPSRPPAPSRPPYLQRDRERPPPTAPGRTSRPPASWWHTAMGGPPCEV